MAKKRKYRIRVRPEHCKACYLCVDFCPKGVLAKSPTAVNKEGVPIVEPARPEACAGCLACTDICPDAAIEIFEVSEGRDG